MTIAEHAARLRQAERERYVKLPPIAPRYAEDCDTLDPYRDEYAGSYGSWPVPYRGAL